MRAPRALYFDGSLRKSLISSTSCTAESSPATSENLVDGVWPSSSLPLFFLPPMPNMPDAPPMRLIRNQNTAIMMMNGNIELIR